MRVGILTFSKSINYGAVLQAAALKQTVEKFGQDVTVIDHPCKMIDSSSKVFDFSYALSPAYVVPHIVNMPIAIKRRRAFKRFWDKHFVFGNDCPENYDMIIAGSDQVWNYKLTGDDMFYFLDFDCPNTKKVAYAASFGLSEIDDGHKSRITPLLKKFDALSVREKTGAALASEMTGGNVQSVVDPTLLLNKEQWMELAKPNFKEKGYIFVYTVFNSDALWEFAYNLSKKTGLPIKTVSYSKFHRHNADYSFTAGPDEWVSYVAAADYVVTNSFHGFAFSVNFEKQFYFELPPAASGVGSRVSDMAKSYGLEGREIKVADAAPIDYSVITPKLEAARKTSLDFICNFLNCQRIER